MEIVQREFIQIHENLKSITAEITDISSVNPWQHNRAKSCITGIESAINKFFKVCDFDKSIVCEEEFYKHLDVVISRLLAYKYKNKDDIMKDFKSLFQSDGPINKLSETLYIMKAEELKKVESKIAELRNKSTIKKVKELKVSKNTNDSKNENNTASAIICTTKKRVSDQDMPNSKKKKTSDQEESSSTRTSDYTDHSNSFSNSNPSSPNKTNIGICQSNPTSPSKTSTVIDQINQSSSNKTSTAIDESNSSSPIKTSIGQIQQSSQKEIILSNIRIIEGKIKLIELDIEEIDDELTILNDTKDITDDIRKRIRELQKNKVKLEIKQEEEKQNKIKLLDNLNLL
jgi:hypothetical protein